VLQVCRDVRRARALQQAAEHRRALGHAQRLQRDNVRVALRRERCERAVRLQLAVRVDAQHAAYAPAHPPDDLPHLGAFLVAERVQH